MKKLILVLLLVSIIACIGCSGVQSYKIKVSGTTGLEFAGSYGGMAPGGNTSIQSVEGTVPKTYTVNASRGVIVTCSFAKLEENGTLNVQIYKNGKVIAQSGTSAPFGLVVLTAQ
jgi:hypothetical protein